MNKIHKKAEVYMGEIFSQVVLWKNYEEFGKVDVTHKSIRYANDVAENWENGILTEDNEHIMLVST